MSDFEVVISTYNWHTIQLHIHCAGKSHTTYLDDSIHTMVGFIVMLDLRRGRGHNDRHLQLGCEKIEKLEIKK